MQNDEDELYKLVVTTDCLVELKYLWTEAACVICETMWQWLFKPFVLSFFGRLSFFKTQIDLLQPLHVNPDLSNSDIFTLAGKYCDKLQENEEITWTSCWDGDSKQSTDVVGYEFQSEVTDCFDHLFQQIAYNLENSLTFKFWEFHFTKQKIRSELHAFSKLIGKVVLQQKMVEAVAGSEEQWGHLREDLVEASAQAENAKDLIPAFSTQ